MNIRLNNREMLFFDLLKTFTENYCATVLID
jgi:hypothetical protein